LLRELSAAAHEYQQAEEESSTPAAKSKPVKKKAPTPAGPGAIAAGGGLASQPAERPEEPESFAATGLDDALDLMSLVNAKSDKASVGQAAAGIERHPEVFALFHRKKKRLSFTFFYNSAVSRSVMVIVWM
jgi:hypothetical protein